MAISTAVWSGTTDQIGQSGQEANDVGQTGNETSKSHLYSESSSAGLVSHAWQV